MAKIGQPTIALSASTARRRTRRRRPAGALAALQAAALAVLPALALAVPAAPVADADRVEGDAWWAHVRYLADDQLEGRFTGSPGYRKAADYVAARFKEYGLAPAGTAGYMQPVEFEELKIISMQS